MSVIYQHPPPPSAGGPASGAPVYHEQTVTGRGSGPTNLTTCKAEWEEVAGVSFPGYVTFNDATAAGAGGAAGTGGSGGGPAHHDDAVRGAGRGLHSFTFQLNLSRV